MNHGSSEPLAADEVVLANGPDVPRGAIIMNTSETEQPQLNQEVWRAWLRKGELEEQTSQRRYKQLAAVAFGIVVVVVTSLHFMAPK